jgi:hypothetical protein
MTAPDYAAPGIFIEGDEGCQVLADFAFEGGERLRGMRVGFVYCWREQHLRRRT